MERWELERLSGFLSDVELRRGERLQVWDDTGVFVAELSMMTLSTAPHASLEDALRDLAYRAFDRDRPDG